MRGKKGKEREEEKMRKYLRSFRFSGTWHDQMMFTGPELWLQRGYQSKSSKVPPYRRSERVQQWNSLLTLTDFLTNQAPIIAPKTSPASTSQPFTFCCQNVHFRRAGTSQSLFIPPFFSVSPAPKIITPISLFCFSIIFFCIISLFFAYCIFLLEFLICKNEEGSVCSSLFVLLKVKPCRAP